MKRCFVVFCLFLCVPILFAQPITDEDGIGTDIILDDPVSGLSIPLSQLPWDWFDARGDMNRDHHPKAEVLDARHTTGSKAANRPRQSQALPRLKSRQKLNQAPVSLVAPRKKPVRVTGPPPR